MSSENKVIPSHHTRADAGLSVSRTSKGPHSRAEEGHPSKSNGHRTGRSLRVMKFGGTSVGDAACIRQVVEIIYTTFRESDSVVVVSAMSGVTNKLLEAASKSENGDSNAVTAIFDCLREKHLSALDQLVSANAERQLVAAKIEQLLQQGQRLCEGTMSLRRLTPRTLDLISSIGERLSAPILAAALTERGVASEAIESTEIVITDSHHSAADPHLELTRERCELRLRPSVERGIIPVVTGFIGATEDGVVTTLGRGGSDYSATILGWALNADEVIIWTDVDGLMSADPRVVPNAVSIPEISYNEAAELAHFGAKVLHPKSLRDVSQRGIPISICNTFAPERPGTRITASAPADGVGIRAVAAIKDVALINVAASNGTKITDPLRRTLRTTESVRADVLVMLQSSSQDDVRVVVSAASAKSLVEALHDEFVREITASDLRPIAADPTVALVTVVGRSLDSLSGVVARTLQVLGRGEIEIRAVAHGSSEYSISVLIGREDVIPAMAAIHSEFQLGRAELIAPAREHPDQISAVAS